MSGAAKSVGGAFGSMATLGLGTAMGGIFGGNSGAGSYTPSAQENALTAEQTQLLRQQRALLTRQLKEQDLLNPILLEQLGIKGVYSDVPNPIKGKPPVRTLTGYEQSNTPEQLAQKKMSEIGLKEAESQLASLPQRTEIENLTRDRTLKGLKGELAIDPTLTRELEQQEQNLRAGLLSQLGTGYETSTPGIEALADFNRRKGELIYGAQRDSITLGEQLSGAREAGSRESIINNAQVGNGLQSSRLGQIFNYGTPGRGLDFAGASAGYQGPLALMQNNRLAQGQNAATTQAGKYALFGNIVGAGAGLMAFSDKRVKKDIKRVGETDGGFPVYTFKYKGSEKTVMGVMAQDVEKKRPDLVHDIFGIKAVDYSGVR